MIDVSKLHFAKTCPLQIFIIYMITWVKFFVSVSKLRFRLDWFKLYDRVPVFF